MVKAEVIKCGCGGVLCPTYMKQSMNETDNGFVQEVNIRWKCTCCKKTVEEKK